MRVAIKGVPFHEIVPIYQTDNVTKWTGLPASAFTTTFYLNGVAASLSHTVTEAGVTGDYVFTTTFDRRGYWAIILYVKDGSSLIETHLFDVDVGLRDQEVTVATAVPGKATVTAIVNGAAGTLTTSSTSG